MTHDDIKRAAMGPLEDRVRDTIKGVLEHVIMEEDMTAQLQSKLHERTERRRGERNGNCARGLTAAAGHRRGGIARQRRSVYRVLARCRSSRRSSSPTGG